MDEYFCPNCGAVLNDQSGFDPAYGTWTCTECGKLLMDDDVYEGDTFEGVAWYCDNCNALLNRQAGFSDSYGTWTCTECGHINGITEDDIIKNDRDDTDNNDTDNNDDELLCPNCGSTLSDQFLFDEYCDDWTCTICGARLHRDYSFDPYTIDSCADSDADEYDEDDYGDDCEDEDDDEDDCEDEYTPRRQSSAGTSSSESRTSPKRQKLPKNELRLQRLKAFIFKHKKIVIGYNCNDLLRKDIEEVHIALYNKGFSNIKIIPVKDICVGSPYKEGEVEQIVIGGSSFFEASDKIAYDVEVIITYHEKKEITIPFSARSLYKKNHVEVVNFLHDLGFTEISEHPLEDLLTGWIKKEGSVQSITVAAGSTLQKNTAYKYDVQITVAYHSFKKHQN